MSTILEFLLLEIYILIMKYMYIITLLYNTMFFTVRALHGVSRKGPQYCHHFISYSSHPHNFYQDAQHLPSYFYNGLVTTITTITIFKCSSSQPSPPSVFKNGLIKPWPITAYPCKMLPGTTFSICVANASIISWLWVIIDWQSLDYANLILVVWFWLGYIIQRPQGQGAGHRERGIGSSARGRNNRLNV